MPHGIKRFYKDRGLTSFIMSKNNTHTAVLAVLGGKEVHVSAANHANATKHVAAELAAITDIVAQGVDGDNNPDVALQLLVLQGSARYLQGNAAAALTRFTQALPLAQALFGTTSQAVTAIQQSIRTAQKGGAAYLLHL